MLAQFIPNAPFYRGMCYAVFHGPRPGTQGFRIGNADTLAQIAVRVERELWPGAAGITVHIHGVVLRSEQCGRRGADDHGDGQRDGFYRLGKNVLYDLGASKGPELMHI